MSDEEPLISRYDPLFLVCLPLIVVVLGTKALWDWAKRKIGG